MAQINSPWDLLLLMASSNVAPFWTFTGRPSTHRLTRAVAAAAGACFAISLLTLIAVFFITVDNWLLSIVIGLCEMMEYPHYQECIIRRRYRLCFALLTPDTSSWMIVNIQFPARSSSLAFIELRRQSCALISKSRPNKQSRPWLSYLSVIPSNVLTWARLRITSPL